MTDSPDHDVGGLSGSLAPGHQFYRRAGARLSAPPADVVDRIENTPAAYHAGYHAFDLAHAAMLVEQGVLPVDVGRRLLEGLRELEDESGDPVPDRVDLGRGPHGGEAHLIATAGERVGGWLHLGRSTHDLVAVAERIALRRRLLRLGAALVDLVETYADRAADTIDAVVPTYTGLRRAQVATIGFHLCAMATPHRRDLDRLVEAYDRLNRSPAGAAVGTTTDVDIDRHRTASLLGFDGVLANAEAVDKATDHAVEVTSVLSAVATNAGRAADSLLCWHSEEFGIVDLPDELCGTSSVMPQKRNPHAVEVVQRAADRVVGAGATRAVEARSAGPTLPPETADRAVDLVATLSAVVDRLTFDRDRAAALVADSWALATDLAAALVTEAGIAWRSAHQIVAVLVRRFEAVERSIHDLDTETLATTAREYLDRPVDLSGLDLDRIRDPRRALARRDGTRGSPAPSAVRRQIADLRRLASDRRTAFAARERALDRAAARRTAAVRRVLDDGTGVGSDQPSGGGTG